MLDKTTLSKMSADQKGTYSELASIKIFKKKGFSVKKILDNAQCNDLILEKNDKKFIAEIKGAADHGYTSFFCEIAARNSSSVEFKPSFWLSQDLDIFCYYSFSEGKLYLYNAKIFKKYAFKMMEEKTKIFDISSGTARGFKFDKKCKEIGFLGCMSQDDTTDNI